MIFFSLEDQAFGVSIGRAASSRISDSRITALLDKMKSSLRWRNFHKALEICLTTLEGYLQGPPISYGFEIVVFALFVTSEFRIYTVLCVGIKEILSCLRGHICSLCAGRSG